MWRRHCGKGENGQIKKVVERELLELFTNQFTIRMNNGKRYRTEEIVSALRDLAD